MRPRQNCWIGGEKKIYILTGCCAPSPHYRVQQEEMAKQKENEERKREKAQQHALAIRQQVKERELSAAARRKETFKEADRQMEEARHRQMKLAEIKEKKLQQLR